MTTVDDDDDESEKKFFFSLWSIPMRKKTTQLVVIVYGRWFMARIVYGMYILYDDDITCKFFNIIDNDVVVAEIV